MLVKEEESMEIIDDEVTAAVTAAAITGSAEVDNTSSSSSTIGSNKELFVLSLAVILSLTNRAPWEELGCNNAPADSVSNKLSQLHSLDFDSMADISLEKLQQQQQQQFSVLGSKADRISDWLAANLLAIATNSRAYPTLVSPQPVTQLWSDQDAVALSFYQESGKDQMLSVLPKPARSLTNGLSDSGININSSSSNGSQSPPSWLSGAEEHLSESELQVGGELDELFDDNFLGQLCDDIDPAFIGSLLDSGCDQLSDSPAAAELLQLENSACAGADWHEAASSSSNSSFSCSYNALGNHTYARAPNAAPQYSNGCHGKSADMRAGMHRNKDPMRLVAAGVKVPYEEIVDCSHQRFLSILQQHNRKQQVVLQEVRKRGKNRLAASKCRQKKSDKVGKLREELHELGQRNSVLRSQLLAAQAEDRRLRDKYTQLYLTVFNRLRDADNRQLDPRHHRLQHAIDGTVILVSRD